LTSTRKNVCGAIKSTIWRRNSRRRITNQHRSGPKPFTAEILSVPLAATRQFEAPELGYRADELEQARREWRTDQQVKGSIVYSRELLDYELKETERLNAMIVKQTRHCAELKAWEEAEKARSKT